VTGPAESRPQESSKLVSALTALEEPAGGLDPRPGDGVGVRGGPGDLQRRQLFGQDLAVDAARRGVQEPTAGEENQGEARLAQPTVRSFGIPPEDAEGPETMPATGKGAILDFLGGRIGTWKVALVQVGRPAAPCAVIDRPAAVAYT